MVLDKDFIAPYLTPLEGALTIGATCWILPSGAARCFGTYTVPRFAPVVVGRSRNREDPDHPAQASCDPKRDTAIAQTVGLVGSWQWQRRRETIRSSTGRGGGAAGWREGGWCFRRTKVNVTARSRVYVP